MAEIHHDCPRCGADCLIIYGCGWDYDFAHCPICGYEDELATNTIPDELEHPDDRAGHLPDNLDRDQPEPPHPPTRCP